MVNDIDENLPSDVQETSAALVALHLPAGVCVFSEGLSMMFCLHMRFQAITLLQLGPLCMQRGKVIF